MINISYDVITKVKKHILFTDIDLNMILSAVKECMDIKNDDKNKLIIKIQELINSKANNYEN